MNYLEDIIATPLAIPLITGPGVITTTLIYTS
ncbi:MarC family protein [Candidatus Nanopusillus massiliensis]|nr:MarC family protein [Candidatus Nanopusillus massiliensis]